MSFKDKTNKIVRNFWADPIGYLLFYFIVGVSIGIILKYGIGFYIIDGMVGSDYFFYDWINNDWSLTGGY